MNPKNTNPTGARGIPQAFNRQAGHAPSSKPVVAQFKTAVSAQSIKRPVAPPAYSPRTMPNAAQPKMANAPGNQKSVGAPPVYRPQPVPKVLQKKSSPAQSSHAGQAPRQPVPPRVDRQNARAPQAPSPKSPPVYPSHRQVSLVQRQTAARGVVQCVNCAICGGNQVSWSDGVNTYNGHAVNCPHYVRTYFTVRDQNTGGLTRSGSFRRLEMVDPGSPATTDSTGLWFPPRAPTFGYVRRHFHDNTGNGGQFVVH
jgi:hypothetical protein